MRAGSGPADEGRGRMRRRFLRLSGRLTRRDHFFWVFNPAYWLFYLVFLCLAHASAVGWQPRIFLWCFLIACIGFSAGFGMRAVYRRVRIERIRPAAVFGRIAAVSFAAANYWYGIDKLLDRLMMRPGDRVVPATWSDYLTYLFYYELLLAGWSVLYFAFRFGSAVLRERERAVRIETLVRQSRIQMLRYQLNPHFLFNALNSVRALIDENPGHAQSMVTELAEFLRYSLVTRDAGDAPLSRELRALRHYFAIEKKRYEDKLQVEFQADPAAEEYPVIPFLVHPLVENAVKYGMRTSRMPLRIRVAASASEDRLRIEVYNTGHWIVPGSGSGTGTGLENVRQRLQALFPGRHGFRIDPEADGVRIRIDLRGIPARTRPAPEAAG